MIRIALLGNPNVGKSSLFNSLTGERQKVANWPGKTIECRRGICRIGHEQVEIFDLPGTYSLSPFSEDERVVEETLRTVDFDVVLQIADSSNLERNLYLTLEILERTDKLVVALNMSDVAAKEGLKIDETRLSGIFGVDFEEIDARDTTSLRLLLLKVVKAAKRPTDHKEVPLASHANIVRHRYQLIQKAVETCVSRRGRSSLGWFDNLALHPISGPALFLAVMFLVFHLTFFLSEPLSQLVDVAWGAPTSFLVSLAAGSGLLPSWAVSLLENGIIPGVGSVISFFPQIAMMMLLLYFLEDSGYLSRVVVVLDVFLKRFGLGGKAFIPLLLGTGCSVPAIMATRIIKDEKTKLITILNIPFMSCSARLPIYILFAGVFFPGNEANVIFLMYMIGFAVAIASAFVMKKYIFKKEEEELLIELPRYHWPYLNNLYMDTQNSVVSFAQRAGTIILAASIAIWFLANAPYGVEYGSKDSLAGVIGAVVAPVFAPLGFNSWQAGLALLNGMVAKEVVISSFATTYGVANEAQLPALISHEFSAPSALAFMVFALLYIPCFATLGTIQSETKSWKLTFFAAIYYSAIAYGIAFLAYLVSSAILGG